MTTTTVSANTGKLIGSPVIDVHQIVVTGVTGYQRILSAPCLLFAWQWVGGTTPNSATEAMAGTGILAHDSGQAAAPAAGTTIDQAFTGMVTQDATVPQGRQFKNPFGGPAVLCPNGLGVNLSSGSDSIVLFVRQVA